MAEIAAGHRRDVAAVAGVLPPGPQRAPASRHPHPSHDAGAPPLPPEPSRTCTRCGQPAGPFGAALCVDCGGELLADVEFELPDD